MSIIYPPSGLAIAESSDNTGQPIDSEAVEALAEVWASMDNRLERFLTNKADRSLDLTDGSCPGYLADAEGMFEQLEELGFRLTRMPETAQD